ncbi:MAG: bacillithiol biosynthesis cysteine-adding enzyme BshC [Chitinophagales bacterium]|nr:bacillithiol biosynthesis cysteine-adding enzyme BshC [Chitinophagales bacterium]
MKKVTIPYNETGYFSKIIHDYLKKDDFLKHFYSHEPEIASFEQAIAEKNKENIDRDLLAETLHQQYANSSRHEAVRSNIELFREKNTYCIVTAHQLNIFTGPLYVIYKIVSTINACNQLKKVYPAKNFIPVFWMGSEDHDFAEINHFHLFGKNYVWNTEAKGAAGRLDPRSIAPVLEELKTVLGESESAVQIIEIFSNAYLQQTTLSAAVRSYLNALFGDHGLVIVDGDDEVFKSLCKDIMEDELLQQSSFTLVTESNKQLEQEYIIQANPREINLFYLQENFRERIVFNQQTGEFNVLNSDISFTKEELLKEIQQKPRQFSPNVILRPLFQQKVLPALAYVGGGGEIAYWLQLKKLFHYHQIAFPVLMLRNSVLWIDDASAKKLDKLSLTPADIFLPADTLINNFMKNHSGDSFLLSENKTRIDHEFAGILQKAILIDPTLEKTILAEKQMIMNSLDKLEAKLLKAEKQKLDTTIQQIRNVRTKLFPEGGLQERHDNFMPFSLRHGTNFFSKLFENLNPFDASYTILVDN